MKLKQIVGMGIVPKASDYKKGKEESRCYIKEKVVTKMKSKGEGWKRGSERRVFSFRGHDNFCAVALNLTKQVIVRRPTNELVLL